MTAECPRLHKYLLTCADGHEGEDDSADDEGDEVDGEVLSLEVEPLLVLPRLGAGHRRFVVVGGGGVIVLVGVDLFLLDGSDVGDEAEEQKLQEIREVSWFVRP